MAKLLVACCILCCLAASPTPAAEPPTADDVSQRIVAAIESGEFDFPLIQEIKKLPRDEQPPLAIRLLKSPHAGMRGHVLSLLAEFPPNAVGDAFREQLNDTSPLNRSKAAWYLAEKTKDAEARKQLLEQAVASEQDAALPALELLGRSNLRGDDVSQVFLAVLKDEARSPRLRAAAILAAGQTKSAQCVPVLAELLDDQTPRKRHRNDTSRLCDVAASALEMIYDIYRLDKPGAFFTAPLEERDRGIAEWKAWCTAQAENPDPNPRMTHLGRLVESSLDALADSPTPAMRARVKNQLQNAFKMRFCLGDLPGADAVLLPSVSDLWRILQVFDEDRWNRHVQSWDNLQLAFDRQFLSNPADIPEDPEGQALAFIRFARTVKSFERIWIWSFCRNFIEVFPDSKHLEDIHTIQAQLEIEFADAKKKVVLHGHIAVLEPKPEPLRHGNMVPEGYSALHDSLQREPSNWSLYGEAVEYFKQWHTAKLAANDPEKPPYIRDPAFPQWIKLYTGNEWPYLGNAIYRWRVLQDADRAVEFADKALILNPVNAKAYALRGMIRADAGTEPVKALADLTRAYELDPASLGGEAETHTGIAFMIKKAIENRQGDLAREYLKTLGPLREFRSGQPFEATEAYTRLANIADGL